MKDFARSFYKSAAWQKCRKSYIDDRVMIDGGLCEQCHNRPGRILHHKIYLSPDNIGDPEITLSHSNLMWVCHECHDLFEGHGRNHAAKPLCVFGPDGQPISIREIDNPPCIS